MSEVHGQCAWCLRTTRRTRMTTWDGDSVCVDCSEPEVLKVLLRRAVELLSEYEFSHFDPNDNGYEPEPVPTCIECGGSEKTGHIRDCQYGDFLADAQEASE